MARKKAGDAGQAEVQEAFDEAAEQGFFGTRTEGKPPNEAFTVAGVTGGTEAADAQREALTSGNGPDEPGEGQ